MKLTWKRISQPQGAEGRGGVERRLVGHEPLPPFSHASFCAQSQEHDTVGVAGGIFWKASWLGRSQA